MLNVIRYMVVAWLAVVFPLTEASSSAQDEANTLLNRRISFHVTMARIVNVLDTLALDHNVPIGFEISRRSSDDTLISISKSDVSVREVLDLVMEQDSAYRWNEIDGVINVTPSADRYEFLALLLETPVAQFAPGTAGNNFGLRNSILKIPEVRTVMASSGVVKARLSDIPSNHQANSGPTADLAMANTTVRGVLNRLVKVSPYRMWVVGMSGERRSELFISL